MLLDAQASSRLRVLAVILPTAPNALHPNFYTLASYFSIVFSVPGMILFVFLFACVSPDTSQNRSSVRAGPCLFAVFTAESPVPRIEFGMQWCFLFVE